MLHRLVIIFLGIILLLSVLASSACEAAPKGSGEWYFARAYQYAVNGKQTWHGRAVAALQQDKGCKAEK